jgi:SAM-dependent methyltransferase
LTNLLSHIAAALAPLAVLYVLRRVRKGLVTRQMRRAFWSRQSVDALRQAGVLDEGIPERLPAFDERLANDTALQVISVAAEHGVFEYLARTPGAGVDAIASAFALSTRQVRAAVEVLLAAGVIESHAGGYALTRAARVYLVKGSPFQEPLPPPTITRLQLKILRSGIVGGTIAKWAAGKANAAQQWASAMHRISFPLGFAQHRLGALNGSVRILDVAGGVGSVCIALALKNPDASFTMIELPGSVAAAERMIRSYGLSQRIRCLALDMFTGDWPAGFDAVMFTNILHSWTDENCRLLLKKASGALKDGGKIVIQEALLDEGRPGPLWTARFSLAVAMAMQGKQFRASELGELLKAEGFGHIRVDRLHGYYSSISATKP